MTSDVFRLQPTEFKKKISIFSFLFSGYVCYTRGRNLDDVHHPFSVELRGFNQTYYALAVLITDDESI